MTTSPPQVNGHRRPLPVITDWQAFLGTPAEQPVVDPAPEPTPEPAAPTIDLVAQAEADAIRTKAYADAEAQRAINEAKAEAIVVKAAEEARKLKLVNDKAEARAVEEQAARDARIAEHNRKRRDAERAEEDAAKQSEIEKQAEAEAFKVVAKADTKWRRWAIAFYIMCAAVALPVQISAFWNPDKPWMAGAPVLLEIAALVVAFGTAAAVASKRPHWHFRVITWALAFIAASVNLWHGVHEFDAATAIATALASIFGPGVWDLHEHGRIRRRDGVLSRREKKTAKKAAKKQAAEKAEMEEREAAQKQAAADAVAAAAAKLAADREALFPKVWEHALQLAADLGEPTVTDVIWKRAKRNVEGADPGESAEILRMRNAAEMRVEAARLKKPVSTVGKGASPQRVIQVKAPARRSSYRPTPPRRKPNDTPKFHPVARALAADAKRQSNTSTEEQK